MSIKIYIKRIIFSAIYFAFGIDALDNVSKTLTRTSLKTTVSHLKKKYRLLKPRPVRFLIELYEFLLSYSADFLDTKNSAHYFIHFCCWGNSYTEKVKKYLLPSLLSNGNLPEATLSCPTTLVIHCDSNTKNTLINSKALKAIQQYASVKFIVLPESLMKSYNSNFRYPKMLFFKKLLKINENIKYHFLGGLQTQALEAALNQRAFISFFMPDFVLPAMFLSKLFTELQGKKLVAASTFKTSCQKAAKQLDALYESDDKTVLSITAKELTSIQINNIHPDAQKFVVDQSNVNFTPSAQLLFKTQNGFILRAFHLHPILIDCYNYRYSIKKDYQPIDKTILNQLLSQDKPYEEQVVVLNDSNNITFMELMDNHGVQKKYIKAKKCTYNQLVNMLAKMIHHYPEIYNNALNHYFLSFKIIFEGSKTMHTTELSKDDKFLCALSHQLKDGYASATDKRQQKTASRK